MFLFSLEGSGFIIALGLILLISGAIMYYCLCKFSVLEASIIDQGKILHSFINKIQEKEQYSAYMQQTNNNEETIDTQMNTHDSQMNFHNSSMINNNTTEKIQVSDDENDSDDDDDDSEDNDDDDDDDDDDDAEFAVNDINEETMVANNSNKNIKVISMEDIPLDVLPIDNTLNINLSTSDTTSNTDNTSIIESNSFEIFNPENEVKHEIKKSSIIIGTSGITKMKVPELRELVVNKGLVTNIDDANKLKKDNLIKLLQLP